MELLDGNELIETPATQVAGNPGQTSEAELEERVDLTYRLLSEGMRKSAIKNALKAQFGVCSRTCENYLARARQRQLADLRETRDEHRAQSLAFYRAIVADSGATLRDRLLAQKRIDDLLGLDTPLRLAIAMGTVGGLDSEGAGRDVALDGAGVLSSIAQAVRASVVDGSRGLSAG
jgi:hypothetical protein